MERIPTRSQHNDTADPWIRMEADSLSDYTARPRILDICGELSGLSTLDLGCGEGMISRALRRRGASVIAVDISEQMIARARQAEEVHQLGIDYRVGDASELDIPESRFDLVVAVFLFNYLNLEQTNRTMRTVHDRLRPGGRFVFVVPHPAFPFMSRVRRPFHVDVKGEAYLDARNRQFEGKIWKRSGTPLDVRFIHKTFGDYIHCLKGAGFERTPSIEELTVTDEHLATDLSFFAPLAGVPLHLAFDVERT